VLAGILSAVLVRVPVEFELGGERAYGLLWLVHGCGAGIALVALVGPVRLHRHPLLPLVASATAVAALAGASDGRVVIAALACACLGASALASEVHAASALGRAAPGPLIAPALGVLDSWMVAAMIVGAAVGPLSTDAVGLRWMLLGAGGLTAALAIASHTLSARGLRLIAVDASTLHHEREPGQLLDVRQRITGTGDDIGELARLERAELRVVAEERGGVGSPPVTARRWSPSARTRGR
jgi:hypothetical protein